MTEQLASNEKVAKLSNIDSLMKHSTFYLTLIFSLIVLIIYFYLNILSNQQINNIAKKNAEIYLNVLSEFRSLYTSEVVVKAKNMGIIVTHDYKDNHNAIPLPATLSMMLGNRLNSSNSQLISRLYSGYPFPWRKESNGHLKDQFSQDAWQALRLEPRQPFYRFEEYQGIMSLRYARADLMRESCIQCHNSHPDSPKVDWKLGDVRGILEVITPIDSDIISANTLIQHTLSLLISILFFALLAIRLVVKKLYTRNIEAKSLVAQTITANKKLEKEVVYRKLAQQEIIKISLQDALTGIANRRKFDQEFKLQWRRAQREKSLLSIIMLDVDNFKNYNDNYGHPKGDDVLHNVAQAINATVQRATDLFCRYGGEEFVLLLANTGIDEAKLIAEKVRRTVVALQIQHEFNSAAEVVTISLGIAEVKADHTHSAEQLLKAADEALYEAKKSGRNCTKLKRLVD